MSDQVELLEDAPEEEAREDYALEPKKVAAVLYAVDIDCLLYTSPSPRD